MTRDEKDAFAPHSRSPAELQAMLRAEQVGLAFLLLRNRDGAQVIVGLGDRDRVTIGRAPDCDIALEWDASTSRVHAELLRVGADWAIIDDGLSRNGTFVDGTRLTGRRRLANGDTVLVGATTIVFRVPPPDGLVTIPTSEQIVDRERITPMQRRVLRSLCEPYVEDRLHAVPATNQEIADTLVLSVDGVKTHLRALFELFGIADLPRGNKRTRLAQLALASGVVDLRVP